MATRIFGVLKGAGIQVREVQPAKPIEQGPLGSSVLVGIFRSGPTKNHPKGTGPGAKWATSLPNGSTQYSRIYGGLTQASEAPLNVEHFYEIAKGAGELTLLRVTDGNEVQASFPVYDRNVAKGYSVTAPTQRATQIADYLAHNGGRWGGRKQCPAFAIADMATAFPQDNQIDLGLPAAALFVDLLAGGVLTIPSVDPTGEYEVIGHDGAGLVTIEGVFSDAILASVATVVPCQIVLVNEHELTGDPEALAIEIGDSGEDSAAKFSLFAHRDGAAVAEWTNVGVKQGTSSYWLDAVDGDDGNYELAGVDLFGGDPNDSLQRPANFAEIAQLDGIDATNSPNVVAVQAHRWARVGAGNGYLEALTQASDAQPVAIVCTFTAATVFDVVYTFDDGISYTRTAEALGVEVDTGLPCLPKFTLRAGNVAHVALDTLTVHVRPLPAGLASLGGVLYVAAAPSEGDVRERYRITGNTADSITVSPAVDLSASVTTPGAPEHLGGTVGPFVLVAGETVVFVDPIAGGDVTLASTLGAGSFTAQQLADEYNALAAAAVAPAVPLVVFRATSDGKLVLRFAHATGASSSGTIKLGTLDGIVGFPGATTVATGADGSIFRVQYRQEMSGGYDGIAEITDSDYEVALDTDPNTGALSRLLPLNTGVIQIGVPGVSSAAVQTAAMAWAFAHNGFAIVELPDTVTDEGAAIAYHEANLAVGAAQDYHAVHFPSYGKITSPYGEGLYATSMTGAIMGFHARKAADVSGFHLAPAGNDANISPLFKDLTTGDKVLNNEALNGYGLIEIRKRGASIYMWGDRIPGNGGRPFLHKRKTVSHIGRVLLTNTEALVFKAINQLGFARAQVQVRDLFLPWWRDGWFDDNGGTGFTDQIEIKVDDTNNPVSERNAGNLHIDIGFDVVNTSERVIFQIGPRGVSESA